MKVAIIGCGRIFDKHFQAINENEKIKLVAVCDKDKKKLLNIKTKGILKYTNINDLVKLSDLDLITIATPSGMHPKHTIQCLNKGHNVLIEKPLGTSIKQVESIFKNNPYKKKIYIVKQNRFNPTIVKLKNFLEKRLFGKIFFVQSNVFWSRNQSYYNSDNWRGTKKLDGGALLNQASHYVDLIFWLFGKPKISSSIRSKRNAKIEMEDTFSSSMILENNIHCNLNVTTSTPFSNLEGSITIISEHASIKISGKALNKVEYIFSENTKLKYLKKFNYKIDNIYGSGHHQIYKEILKDLNHKNIKNESIPAKEGIDSLKWILKQYKGRIY